MWGPNFTGVNKLILKLLTLCFSVEVTVLDNEILK